MTNRMSQWMVLLLLLLPIAALPAAAQADKDRAALLETREAVWRAWFAGDTARLQKLLPPETIAISAGEHAWRGRDAILQEAARFHAGGGKLLRLEFPRTEIQRYGEVAIVYSEYVLEFDSGGKHTTSAGRVTETFVRKNGEWLNPGWHTDAEK
jgi:ketosteroid isomerase-like protein